MGKTKFKKLILCITIAITTGVFLSVGLAFAGFYISPVPVNFGGTTTSIDLSLSYTSTSLPYYWMIENRYSAPSWLTIDGAGTWQATGTSPDPQYVHMTANRAGLSPGTYTWVMQTKRGYVTGWTYQDITVSMTVFNAPSLSATPASLDFGAGTTTLNITVQNGQNCNTLNWTASDNAAWLNISPSSGSLGAGASQQMTATVSRAGLAGNYSGTISFGGNGGSKNVSVSMKALAISGYIKHGDGVQMPGATVVIKKGGSTIATLTTPTDLAKGDGYYEKIGLMSGIYDITATYPDYPFNPLQITLGDIDMPNADLYTYIIKGYIKRYGTGEGINGVDVIIKEGETVIDTIRTPTPGGDDGYYEKRVSGGTYTIEAANP